MKAPRRGFAIALRGAIALRATSIFAAPFRHKDPRVGQTRPPSAQPPLTMRSFLCLLLASAAFAAPTRTEYDRPFDLVAHLALRNEARLEELQRAHAN